MQNSYFNNARILMLSVLLAGGVKPLFASQITNVHENAALQTNNQQKQTVKGTVKDANGEPIIGASVKVKGSTGGTVTDIDGNFTLDVPAGAELEISSIGYLKQVVKAKANVAIVLKDDSQTLDELVVVGYGVQKKENLTGAVASMNAEKLATRPVSSLSSALAGEMAGVTAVQTSGAPGSQNASITVRGKNSINAASPLVIVDGVPGSMNVINPAEIESVTVLKDAASAAIYGVQAANGVILITTKKGKTGKTTVSYNATFSWSSLLAKLDLVDAYGYAYLYNEAYLNDHPGAKKPFSDETVEKYRTGQLPSTDWYKEALTGSGFEHQHNLSLSGGNDKTTYNMYLGYLGQEGVTKDLDYNRINARMNITSQINKYITLGLNASGYRGTKQDAWSGYNQVIQGISRSHPTDPVYDEDGNFKYVGVDNPVAVQGRDKTGWQKTIDQEVFLIGSAEIKPIKDLSIKGVYSWRNWTQDQLGFKKTWGYGTYNSGQREGYVRNYNYDYLTGQILVNYNKSFGDHNLGVLAGMESYDVKYRYVTANRKGGGNNNLDSSLNTLDASSQKNSSGGTEMTRLSYFGRLQYNYAGKYLFEANVRRDASSRFPKDSRWGTFPAFSAGWRISEEAFMKNVDWLSNLKLRLGWGKTGNEELKSSDLYPAVPTYAYGSYMFGNSLYSTAYESRLVNDQLKWATVTNYELGIDAGFLNNKLTMELSVYKKKTNDMLLYLPLQGVIGLDAPAQNVGSVENRGFELVLGHNNRIGKDWSYNLSLNMGYNKNEIIDMAGTDGPIDNGNGGTDDTQWNIEGYGVSSWYGYVADGLFRSEEELKKGPLRTGNEKLGDIRYKDLDDDGKITAADRKIIGNKMPKWTGGFNFSVGYKNFELSGLLQGAFDTKRYYNGESSYAFYNSASCLNKHWDRWSEENPNGNFPRLSLSSQTNNVLSTFWLQDASYVRMKNLTLAYTLPSDLISRIGLSFAQVYLAGENLFTISGLDKGLDPESGNSRGWSYSNVRKISCGLKLTF
ncbi:TonB-dependent receptor [uncultured Prevotella sp.]|uniref:SusC/RagA family TonB-linked outer membrane protein n=1 Tax=uncultured Prevotella sp. TaxID=159272 RepID=UPI0025E6AA12|nr:TonB-dependent receptor [uncultured Prevotella sp.]